MKPLAAVVGGAKISSQDRASLENLLAKVDLLVIGGAMANTFLAAQGKNVGKSLSEPDLIDTAKKILSEAKAKNCDIVLPVDVVVAKKFKPGVPTRSVMIDAVGADEMILDIGLQSVALTAARLATTRTIVWNGPMGAFEMSPFDAGTVTLPARSRSSPARAF